MSSVTVVTVAVGSQLKRTVITMSREFPPEGRMSRSEV